MSSQWLDRLLAVGVGRSPRLGREGRGPGGARPARTARPKQAVLATRGHALRSVTQPRSRNRVAPRTRHLADRDGTLEAAASQSEPHGVERQAGRRAEERSDLGAATAAHARHVRSQRSREREACVDLVGEILDADVDPEEPARRRIERDGEQ